MLLLSAAGAFAQEQIPPEKMKELRKFDPADIVPEAREGEPRERQDGKGRTQSKRNAGTSASPAPISAAVDSTLPNPPAAPAAKAPTAPRTAPSLAPPSLAPKNPVVLTQSAVTKTQPSEPAASGAPAPAAAVDRSARSSRLSLPLIFFLLSLTLLALVVVTVKLKKDLSKL